MIIKINKFIGGVKKNIQTLLARKQQAEGLFSIKGQVGIVMILVLAVALVLYAVVLNIQRASIGKTLTIVAANTAASKLASIVASYGQYVMWTYLKGETEKCEHTSILMRIISIVICIIVIIICICTEQWYLLILAVMALAMAIVTLAIDAMIIQPGITDMWNKMWADSLDMISSALEQGLMTGLQTASTDGVKLPDVIDYDLDGSFGDLADMTDKTSAPDYISRFAVFYTKRMQDVPAPDTHVVDNFITATEDFLIRNKPETDPPPPAPPDWGLFDPLACDEGSTHPCCSADPWNDPNFPAMCDACCVPEYDPTDPALPPAACCSDPDGCTDGTVCPIPIRPACCSIPESCEGTEGFKGGNPATCGARSYLGAAYPYVFENYREDSTNNPDPDPAIALTNPSFHEFLGRDDEIGPYMVKSNAPSWHIDIPDGAQLLPVPPFALAVDTRLLRDTTGYYKAPYSTPLRGDDNRSSIFPFFYKMADWGADLSSLTYGTMAGEQDDAQCFWCDSNEPNAVCNAAPPPVLPEEVEVRYGGKLVLPNSPALAQYSGGWCVDANNAGIVGEPPQLLDRVPSIPAIFAADNVCAQDVGGWKRGSDRFCSAAWPYSSRCNKHTTPICHMVPADSTSPQKDCSCSESTVPDTAWPEDQLDDMVYGLPEFYLWAKDFLNNSNRQLYFNLISWYDQVALWIEPPCPDPLNCPGSYTKSSTGGALFRWRDTMRSFVNPITDWITPPAGSEYVSAGCNISAGGISSWCVPPSQSLDNSKYSQTHTPGQAGYLGSECVGVSQGEAATFDYNANGTRGDLEDVIACMNWNLNDPAVDLNGNPIIHPGTGVQAVGNLEKFEACQDACNNDIALAQAYCSLLPRSLVPGFDDAVFVPPPALGNAVILTNCMSNATSNGILGCVAYCNNGVDPALPGSGAYSGAGYTHVTNAATPPDLSAPGTPIPNFIWPSAAGWTNIMAMITHANNCLNDPLTPPVAGLCFNPLDTVDCNPANMQACLCQWTAVEMGTCFETCGAGLTPFLDAVNAALAVAGGSCGIPAWMDMLDRSVAAAQNQMAKMAKRYLFLQGRYQEATDLLTIFNTAIAEFTAYLDGGTDFSNIDSPAEALIAARQELGTTDEDPLEGSATDKKLPSQATYVWQDEENPDGTAGKWHAVKSEGRLPGRCTKVGCITRRWPWIKTETSSWGTERCFILKARRGRVMARVIRYDEDVPSHKRITFPDGTLIWKPRTAHPLSPSGVAMSDLEAACQTVLAYEADVHDAHWNWSPEGDGDGGWKNAFMLNYPPGYFVKDSPTLNAYLNTPEYKECWDWVHNMMLSYGVSTETCAEYYVRGHSAGYNSDNGFSIKFVPCPASFLAGQE